MITSYSKDPRSEYLGKIRNLVKCDSYFNRYHNYISDFAFVTDFSVIMWQDQHRSRCGETFEDGGWNLRYSFETLDNLQERSWRWESGLQNVHQSHIRFVHSVCSFGLDIGIFRKPDHLREWQWYGPRLLLDKWCQAHWAFICRKK